MSASRPKPMTGLYTDGLRCKVIKNFLVTQFFIAYLPVFNAWLLICRAQRQMRG